jgi:MFS family permease
MVGVSIKELLMTLAIIFKWNVYLFIPFTSIDGLCGGWVVQLAIASSAISDCTSAGKMRSFLIAVYTFVLAVGFSLGTFVSGFIVVRFGYDYSMATACGMAIVGFIITCFIPETLSESERKQHDFSCIGNIKDILKFYTEENPDPQQGSARWKYITAAFSFFFVMMSGLGVSSIETFYLLDSPFCFNPEMISIFETVKVCVSEAAVLTGIKVMQRCITDETIAFLVTISGVTRYVFFGIASSSTYLYVGQNFIQSYCQKSCSYQVLYAFVLPMILENLSTLKHWKHVFLI